MIFKTVQSVALVGLVLLACACDQEEVAELGPRPVRTITVEEPASTRERVFSGQLKAAEGTGIGFQVGGRIVSLGVSVGRRYAKGQMIGELDSDDYVNQLADAQAQLGQAKQELQRTRRLFEADGASKSQLDAATARFTSATAAANQAQKRVDDCVLKMPYTGQIGDVLAEAQQVVSAGQEVLTILGEEGLEFEVGVTADLVGEISEGLPVVLEVSGRTDLVYSGEVVEVSPQVASNTTYPVTIAVEGADERIRAGMDGLARLLLPIDSPNTVAIPFQCVVSQAGAEPFVWIVKSKGDGIGVVERRAVALGMLEANGLVGITSGLVPGDRVVSRGVHRIDEGLEVLLDSEA